MSKKRQPYKEKKHMNFLDIPCNSILLMEIFSLCNKSKEGVIPQKKVDSSEQNSIIQELEKKKFIKRMRKTQKKGRGGIPYSIKTERTLSEEIFNNLIEFSIWRCERYFFFPLTYNAKNLKKDFDLDSFFEEWLSNTFLEYYRANKKHIEYTFKKDGTKHHFGGLIDGFIFNFLANEEDPSKIKQVKSQIEESCDKCKDIKLPPLSKERKKSFLNFCKKYVEDKLWHMGRYELAIAGNITSIEQILKEHKGKEPLSPPSRKWKEAAERVEEQFKKV